MNPACQRVEFVHLQRLVIFGNGFSFNEGDELFSLMLPDFLCYFLEICVSLPNPLAKAGSPIFPRLFPFLTRKGVRG